MNTQVTATSMQVKAVAEDGLLIINELDADSAANWKVSANASYGTLVELAPTSTYDAEHWYHNKSNDQNNAKASQAASTYAVLSDDTAWARDEGSGKTGVYFIDADGKNDKDDSEKAYVLQNRFYIKSSGNEITLGSGNAYLGLYINKVKVTGMNSSTGSANLDKSLRVAVVVDGEVFIYAPVDGATLTYKVGGYTLIDSSATDEESNRDYAHSVTATSVPATYLRNDITAVAAIPAITVAKTSTIPVDIYIYFEGEDPQCKSANLTATLDTLNVEVVFGITTVTE